MLRYLFVSSLLLIIALPAFAGMCGGGLSGRSSSGEFYIGQGDEIGQGDCDFKEEMIVVSKKKTQTKQYKFKRECEYVIDKTGSRIGFSCYANGRSPLAGARFRLRSSPKEKGYCGNSPRWYYRCVFGCSEAVPKTFDISPEECDG